MDYAQNALGISHRFIAGHLKPGGVCIDATAGRGRDTLFMARLVGDRGRVLSFDIQPDAVESTRALLAAEGIRCAEVFLACHSKMDLYAERESADAIMFNFGWLPGGDHSKFSRFETSRIAVEKGLSLLKKGGVMSLCLYCGKENGYEEKEALLAFLKTTDPKRYSVLLTDYINRTGDPPIAVLITRD